MKSPKLYLVDTGLACHLLGIRSERQLATHHLRGALFENYVVAEVVKAYRHHRRGATRVLFWRPTWLRLPRYASHLITGDRRHFGAYYGTTVAGVTILRPSDYLRAAAAPQQELAAR